MQLDISMIDEELGTRDKKGDWKPSYLFSYGPLFEFPVKPLNIVKWVFLILVISFLGYFFMD